MLQSESLDIAGAVTVIKATIDTFNSMRCNSSWELLWLEVTALFDKIEHKRGLLRSVVPSRPARQRNLPACLQSSVVMAGTGSQSSRAIRGSSDHAYKVDLYFPTLDSIHSEMNKRFHERNIALMKAVDSLNPKSTVFLQYEPLLPHFEHYHIDSTRLENELVLFRALFSQIDEICDKNSLSNVWEAIIPVEDAFPSLKTAVVIAMTFGISTAIVERSFSSLRRIKTYMRSTMTQGRLDDLALLNIERELSSKMWDCLPSLVMKFAQSQKF